MGLSRSPVGVVSGWEITQGFRQTVGIRKTLCFYITRIIWCPQGGAEKKRNVRVDSVPKGRRGRVRVAQLVRRCLIRFPTGCPVGVRNYPVPAHDPPQDQQACFQGGGTDDRCLYAETGGGARGGMGQCPLRNPEGESPHRWA